MPNSKQRNAKQKQRKRLARQKSQKVQGLENAKVKTLNEMFKNGSLPKQLESRVTLRKGR